MTELEEVKQALDQVLDYLRKQNLGEFGKDTQAITLKALHKVENLILHGVVFNEAKEIDKQLKSEHNEYIIKSNEEVWLYSEVELKPLPPKECDMCGTLIDHRLTKCSDCGFN